MKGLLEFLLVSLCLQGICSAHPCEVIPGRLVQIDAGNGHVFGVNKAGQIHTLYGKTLTQVPGDATHVTVGPAGVWGVTQNMNTYKMVGGTWTKTAGSFQQIDAGGGQFVVGVDSDNQVYCLPRSATIASEDLSPSDWVKIEGKMKRYRCGPLGCWGLNSTGSIFYRYGVHPQYCAGTKWQHVPGDFVSIEVGSDGSVHVVNSKGHVHRREGITPCNPTGNSWDWLGLREVKFRTIQQVSYDLNILWALDANDQILKCKGEGNTPKPFFE